MPAGHSVETDPSPGAWVAAALRRDRSVASLVPPLFAAYARVLHPAVRYSGDDDVDVRWDEVAAHNGTTAHRLMQWPALTGSWEHVGEEDQPGVWNDHPAEGHLPAHVARTLAGLLAGWTTTPQECWFGWCDDAAPDRPHLSLPGCDVLLRSGPVEETDLARVRRALGLAPDEVVAAAPDGGNLFAGLSHLMEHAR